jgi:hypothetical protein
VREPHSCLLENSIKEKARTIEKTPGEALDTAVRLSWDYIST